MEKTTRIRTWSPKRPGYWKWYHRSQPKSVLEVFKAIRWLVHQHDPPWKVSRRGRPVRVTPRDYACLLIFMRYYDMSYRDIAGLAEMLLGKSVDHSSIGWAIQRISQEYLDELLYNLFLCIDAILQGGVYITDSTGFSLDRYGKRRVKMKVLRVKQTVKFHAAVKHYPRHGVTVLVTATVSHGTAHDSCYYDFLTRKIFHGIVLSDRGYDSEEYLRLGYRRGFIPMIKQRESCGTSLIRQKARRDFCETIYKQFRGMVEGVFGGTETGYCNRTRCRLHHTRQTHVMLLAVVQNLKAYARVIELLRGGMIY